VADRARAFGMRVVAYDPFVSADRARQMGVELLSLDQAVAEADFLTIHLPKTKETTGLINRDLLLKAKPAMRLINVARGGIVDETELAEAIRDGVIAGAALDVFAVEPTTSSRCSSSSRSSSLLISARPPGRHRTRPATRSPTWSTSHSPASSCRSPSTSTLPRANETLRPFLPLAERLGRLFASLVGAAPQQLEVCTEGRHRRLRHAHPHPGRVEGLLRIRHRRAGHLRQRAATRQGPRCRSS
jgi:D-3-phosphoglycerate dehydrogenase